MLKKKVASDSKNFAEKVFAIVKRIPRGKVLTYGQVATLAGVPRAARIVGGVLYQQGRELKLPWQRVINRSGKISTYRVGMGEVQRQRLEKEGLKFKRDGAVDLKRYQWWPSEKLLKSFELDEETAWRINERLGF